MTTKTKTRDLAQHRATGRTYLAALSEACPPETWREIVERAIEDAKAGDAKARDWLASYLVGRPDGQQSPCIRSRSRKSPARTR